MSIYSDIRKALETQVDSNSASLPISWQNVIYSPTTGTPFVQFQFQPTLKRAAVLGLSPQERYQGICTLLVHYDEDAGPGASQTAVDTLLDDFPVHTTLTYNSKDVQIEYSQQGSPYLNSPWFVTPITVGWYCYN